MENKIPLPIIGLLPQIVEKYYTHSTLTSLIELCDFNAVMDGSKQTRILTTLAEVNKIHVNPLGFLGKFIASIMDKNDEGSKDDRKQIEDALAKYGLTYRLEKIMPLDGISGSITAEEEAFLSIDFSNVEFREIVKTYADALNQRLVEMRICITNNAPLSAVFMAGSALEGVLISLAESKPKEFNEAPQSPKREGSVLPFPQWTLANWIDVSYGLGYLREDVKKFSHALRDFRNYIHPREQVKRSFNPDMHTAKICSQTLYATIDDLSKRGLLKTEKTDEQN